MKLSLIFIFASLLCLPSWALETKAEPESVGDKEYTFFKGEKTTIKNPFELRDPFKEDGMKRASKKKGVSTHPMKDGNTFTNIPSVEVISSLEKVRVVGVLLGKERRALIRLGEGKDIIILKEGMKVGLDGVELKAILPGGVVFVEKIRNVYDQDEYLETVIPVSAD